eukprot:gene48007-10209_t
MTALTNLGDVGTAWNQAVSYLTTRWVFLRLDNATYLTAAGE